MHNQFDVAAEKYRAALAMRPSSPEALNGLAGLLIKEEHYQQAVDIYGELLRVEPANTEAWRGLFISYARDGQNQQALDVARRFPPRVRVVMEQDPEYLRTLATIYEVRRPPRGCAKACSHRRSRFLSPTTA